MKRGGRSMSPGSVVLAVCALMALVTVPPTAQSTADASFLIVNACVFDGDRLLEKTDVVVEGGIIRAVGRDLPRSQRLAVIDGANSTIIPGLIDAHAHVTTVGDPRQALQFGVTTVLDLGAAGVPQEQVFDVRAVAKTATDMSEVFSAGFLASSRRPAGSTRPLVTSIDDAVRFADARHADGADYLKLQLNGARSATLGDPNMSEAIARALVAQAHANRMKAIAHVETLADVEVALAAGVDGLAHVWRRGGANADIARRITGRGVFVIATLTIPDGFLEGRARLREDPRFQGRLSASLLDHSTRPITAPLAGTSLDELRANYAAHRDGVQSLVQAGATLLVGTDASAGATPAAHGISVHREIELLTEAGLSLLQVLRAATSTTADAFSLPDRGRIAVGRRADLVMVRGNPIDDITATRDILRVCERASSFADNDQISRDTRSRREGVLAMRDLIGHSVTVRNKGIQIWRKEPVGVMERDRRDRQRRSIGAGLRPRGLGLILVAIGALFIVAPTSLDGSLLPSPQTPINKEPPSRGGNRCAVLIAAAVVLAGHTLSAQTLDPAFEKARAARNAAITTGDREGFMRHTTDDFVYVSLEGQVMTRAERAAADQGNNEQPARQPVTDAKVRLYGDTIITSGRGALNVRGVMQPVRVVQVWMKRDGEWKVAHAQDTPVAGKEQ